MRVGDIVKPVGYNGGKSGLVRMVEGNKVAVRWVMGSGWGHTVVYDSSELEVQA